MWEVQAAPFALRSSSGTISITSSGMRRYLMLLPRMMTSGRRQKRSPSREVRVTSRRLRAVERGVQGYIRAGAHAGG